MVLGFTATQVFADVDTSQDFFDQSTGTFDQDYFSWSYNIPANSGEFVLDLDFNYLYTNFSQYFEDTQNDELDIYIGSLMYEGSIYALTHGTTAILASFPDSVTVGTNHYQIPIVNSGTNTSISIYFSLSSGNLDGQAMETDLGYDAIFSIYAVDPGDMIEPEFTYSNLSVDTPYYDLVTAAEVQAELHATDDEDGDVSSRIEVYDDQYTSETKVVGGDYYIMYRVSDLSGNYAYLRVDIEVIDDRLPYLITSNEYAPGGEYTVIDTYTNGAVLDYSWYYGQTVGDYEDFWLHYFLVDEYYGVWDFTDASWTESSSNMTLFMMDPSEITVGTYSMTYTIEDPSGNTSTITINLDVLQNQAPVISGPESLTVEATTFNLPSIVSNYSATDTEDGTATVTASPVDGETYSNIWTSAHTVGDHTLYLSSIDSMGLETIKAVTIHVVDTTIPVIKVSGIVSTTYTHTVHMSDTSSLATLIGSITATDAYYGNLTSSLVIPAYPSFTTPGSSNMTITVTDPSGNIATLVLTVVVEDDINPVVNGPIKIVKGKTASLTLSEVTSQLSAVDNVDGTLSVSVVQDGYTGNATVIGSYLVRYKAEDLSGNITYHDVRIWVVDNVAPVWVVDDYFINLGLNESMTRTELVALLQASGMLANDISYTVTFLTDEYTGNEEIEGVYSVVMRVTYEDGSEDEISVQLSVPEDLSDGDIIVVEPDVELTGFQQAWLSLKTFFVNSWDWIKGAANSVKSAFVWTYDHALKPAWDFFFVKDTDVIPDTVVTTAQNVTTTSGVTTTTTLPYTTTTAPLQNL